MSAGIESEYAVEVAIRCDEMREKLDRLLSSRRVADRLKGLSLLDDMGWASEWGDDRILQIAGRHIADRNNKCRWRATGVVAQFIDTKPEKVWRIIRRYGSSRDDDMRAAIGCMLLEELIADDPPKWLDRAVRAARRSTNFGRTLTYCWFTARPRKGEKPVTFCLSKRGKRFVVRPLAYRSQPVARKGLVAVRIRLLKNGRVSYISPSVVS